MLWGLGFGVWGFGFVLGFGFWVLGVWDLQHMQQHNFCFAETLSVGVCDAHFAEIERGWRLPQHTRITKHTSPITNWTFKEGEGFMVWSLGFGVWGLGFGVWVLILGLGVCTPTRRAQVGRRERLKSRQRYPPGSPVTPMR